jgi:hypothetical protein
MDDYIEKPTRIKQQIKGINDTPAQVKFVGKGIYQILDSNGIKHNFIIDNLYYCPTVPVRVLSPQHLDAMWRKQTSYHRFSVMLNSEGCLMTWI